MELSSINDKKTPTDDIFLLLFTHIPQLLLLYIRLYHSIYE